MSGIWLGLSLIIFLTIVRFLITIVVDAISVAVGAQGFSPLVLGGDDGIYHYQTALMVAEGMNDVALLNSYPLIIGLIMRWTGFTEILVYKIVNTIIASGCALLGIYLFATIAEIGLLEAFSVPHGWLVLVLFGIYPSTLAYASLSLYRDALIYFTHLASIILIVQFVRNRRLIYIVPLIAMVLLLFSLRWYAVFSLVLGYIIWRLYQANNTKKLMPGMMEVFFLSLVIVIVLWKLDLLPYSQRFQEVMDLRARIVALEAGSNMGIDFNRYGLALVVPLYLYSVVSNSLGPLPWQIKNALSALLLIAEAPLFVLTLCLCLRNRRYMDPIAALVSLEAALWFLILGFINDNIGTATRLRPVGWHLLFVLSAVVSYRAWREKGAYSACKLGAKRKVRY